MESLLVVTNCPHRDCAEDIARELVEARLAACVNILAPCLSIYSWEGRVDQAEEVPVLIKTTTACYPALEATIRRRHPYEVPEIIALPITHGLPAYLNWVAEETLKP